MSCKETQIPTVDNTPQPCCEKFSTECSVHPDILTNLGLPINSNLNDIVNKIDELIVASGNTFLALIDTINSYVGQQGKYLRINSAANAVEVVSLSTVAETNDYNDLDNKPTIDGTETKVQAGTNITVTGNGSTATPYVISSSATGSNTDLFYDIATRLLSSSTGNDVVLPQAGFVFDGLMTVADKKLARQSYRLSTLFTFNSFANVANDFSDLGVIASGTYIYFETINGNKYFGIGSSSPGINQESGKGLYIRTDDGVSTGILLNNKLGTFSGYTIYSASPTAGIADPSATLYINEPFNLSRLRLPIQDLIFNEFTDLPLASSIEVGTRASVVNDPTPSNNGIYMGTGTSIGNPAISWTKV